MWREAIIEVGRKVITNENGKKITVVYRVIRDILRGRSTGAELYCYGVEVVIPGCGDIASVRCVTCSGERIMALAKLLARNKVTPCGVMDVIDDWLREN